MGKNLDFIPPRQKKNEQKTRKIDQNKSNN